MKKILSILPIAILAFLLNGCGQKEVIKKPVEYRIEASTSASNPHASYKDKRTLKVMHIGGDSIVATTNIMYRNEKSALLPYKYSRWAEIPSTQLERNLTARLVDFNFFKSVVAEESYVAPDLFLESTLMNLEEVFTSSSESHVRVRIRFILIDRLTAKTIDTITIDETVQVKKPHDGASTAVVAFNEALSKVFGKVENWIENIAIKKQ